MNSMFQRFRSLETGFISTPRIVTEQPLDREIELLRTSMKALYDQAPNAGWSLYSKPLSEKYPQVYNGYLSPPMETKSGSLHGLMFIGHHEQNPDDLVVAYIIANSQAVLLESLGFRSSSDGQFVIDFLHDDHTLLATRDDREVKETLAFWYDVLVEAEALLRAAGINHQYLDPSQHNAGYGVQTRE